MAGSRRRFGFGVIGELLIVFVGVFVALAADSWWEEQEALGRLEVGLEALAADLIVAGAELDSAIAGDSTIVLALSPIIVALLDDGDLPAGAPAEAGLPIRLPVIPYGSLSATVGGGLTRLLSTPASQSTVVETLSRLERNDRIMEQLAAEARGAGDDMARGRLEFDEDWPREPDFTVALGTYAGRIANIVLLAQRFNEAVASLSEVVRQELALLRGS